MLFWEVVFKASTVFRSYETWPSSPSYQLTFDESSTIRYAKSSLTSFIFADSEDVGDFQFTLWSFVCLLFAYNCIILNLKSVIWAIGNNFNLSFCILLVLFSFQIGFSCCGLSKALRIWRSYLFFLCVVGSPWKKYLHCNGDFNFGSIL